MKHEPWELDLLIHAACCLENNTAVACYILDTHQSILIIFLVDNKVQCANILSRLANFV